MDTKTHVKYWIGIAVVFLLFDRYLARRDNKLLKLCNDVMHYRSVKDGIDYNKLEDDKNDNDKN